MRKKIIVALGVMVLSFGIMACGNGDDTQQEQVVGNQTTEETEQPTGASTDELSKGITSKGELDKDHKLVVIAKNGNETTVDLEIEVEFYNKEGVVVGSDSEDFYAVSARQEIAHEFYNTPEAFDSYKIYADATAAGGSFKGYMDKVESSANDTGEQIAVQVKNNGDSLISTIRICVVFYQGDKIVAAEEGLESDIKGGRSANFNVDYPYQIGFDKYKVFVNEAYSY